MILLLLSFDEKKIKNSNISRDSKYFFSGSLREE